ncbi:MAG: HigA family addiction module antitoxin [Sulfuricaulis sp.]
MATITEKSSRMHNPAHPGDILRELYLKPLGITITQTAKALGVSRKHVSAIVNARAAVTPDMAVRLAAVFATEPEVWVNIQAQYDLWTVSKHARPKVKPLVTKKAA